MGDPCPCPRQSFAWPLGLAPNRKTSNVGRARPSLCPGDWASDACLRPGGTPENSPAFQRRDHARNRASPEGTAESRENDGERAADSAVPSGLVLTAREPGTQVPGYSRLSLRDKRTAGLNPANTVRRNGAGPCPRPSFAWPLGLAPNRKTSNVGRARPSLFPGIGSAWRPARCLRRPAENLLASHARKVSRVVGLPGTSRRDADWCDRDGRAPPNSTAGASVPVPRRLGAERSLGFRPGGTPEHSPALQRRARWGETPSSRRTSGARRTQ